MKNYKKYLKIFFIIVILLLAGQVELPYSIKIIGRLYPNKEWRLVNSQNDVITTSYINHLKGGLRQNKVISFDRGDVASININPVLNVGSTVEIGDTLVKISSNESQRIRSVILGKLEAAVANFFSKLPNLFSRFYR